MDDRKKDDTAHLRVPGTGQGLGRKPSILRRLSRNTLNIVTEAEQEAEREAKQAQEAAPGEQSEHSIVKDEASFEKYKKRIGELFDRGVAKALKALKGKGTPQDNPSSAADDASGKEARVQRSWTELTEASVKVDEDFKPHHDKFKACFESA